MWRAKLAFNSISELLAVRPTNAFFAVYSLGKPGRKLDELKERYQKTCRKLHALHNEYVLLLNEAADYERDYRTVLLPGLLEYQQTVQEDMVAKWLVPADGAGRHGYQVVYQQTVPVKCLCCLFCEWEFWIFQDNKMTVE